MKPVIEYTDIKYIKRLKSVDKFKAIGELALVFRGTPVCADLDGLILALREREELLSTGIGFGLAVPHVKIPAVRELAFAVGISGKGIPIESMDGKPVRLVILLVAGERQQKEYLTLLAAILNILKKKGVKERIIRSRSAVSVMRIISEHDGPVS